LIRYNDILRVELARLDDDEAHLTGEIDKVGAVSSMVSPRTEWVDKHIIGDD
jgi:hypothetical protein